MNEGAPVPECEGCRQRDELIAMLVSKQEELEARLDAQEKELARHRELLGLNSSNSSKPPSSDGPKTSKERKKKRKRRLKAKSKESKRGGSQRELLPPEEVDALHVCKPTTCSCCGEALSGEDPNPRRHQVCELPEKLYRVDEYQLHKLDCSHCGKSTRAQLPEGVTLSPFGNRLQAWMVMMTVIGLSRRDNQELLSEMGIHVSLGALNKVEQRASRALDEPVQAVAEAVRESPVVHGDETGWKTRGERRWLWLACTSVAALFMVHTRRNTEAAQLLLGQDFDNILNSDRFGAYSWVDLHKRQLCWAHLDRDFQRMADSSHPHAKRIGAALMLSTDLLFFFWHRVRDGTLPRHEFQSKVENAVKPHILRLLSEGVTCGHRKTQGTCKHILKRQTALWTFVENQGVDPTNNHAERTLRKGVLWRKRSFGTHSASGERFVERILTARLTLRLQARSFYSFLKDLFHAAATKAPAPSLLPAPT